MRARRAFFPPSLRVMSRQGRRLPDASRADPYAPDKTYGSQPRVYDGSSVPVIRSDPGLTGSPTRRSAGALSSPIPLGHGSSLRRIRRGSRRLVRRLLHRQGHVRTSLRILPTAPAPAFPSRSPPLLTSRRKKTGLDRTRRKRSERTLRNGETNSKDRGSDPGRHVRQAAFRARSCLVFGFPCTFMVHGSPAPGAGRKKFFPAFFPEDGTGAEREHPARTAGCATPGLPFPNGSGSMTGSFRNPLHPAAKQVVYFLIRQGG